jgi:hypothetical protein
MGAPALLAAIAALAPAQGGLAATERQIPNRDHRTLVDLQLPACAVGARLRSRDQLDLEVELVSPFDDAVDPEAIQADEAANVILHPLFLLTPRFRTTQSLLRAADVFLSGSHSPVNLQDPKS